MLCFTSTVDPDPGRRRLTKGSKYAIWAVVVIIAIMTVVSVILAIKVKCETDPNKMSAYRLSKTILAAARRLDADFNEQTFAEYEDLQRIYNDKFAEKLLINAGSVKANIRKASSICTRATARFRQGDSSEFAHLMIELGEATTEEQLDTVVTRSMREFVQQ